MEAEKNSGEKAKSPRRPAFQRFIKALSPLPFLIKVRNYYIRSLTECAGRANYSGMAAGAPGTAMSLPKSFSTASSRNEEEFRELVRAASQRTAFSRSSSASGGGVVVLKPQPAAPAPPFPRSFSTSTAPMVGRIDEESPCYFPGSFKKTVVEDDVRFPRSRSCNTSQDSQVQTRVAALK